MDVAKRNANDGISYLQVAEGGLNETTNIIVRMRELTDLGLGREDLEDAALELNDKLWRVKATMPKPGPSGEANGELYTFLIEDDT